jgi:hypothetical protein
VYPSTGGDEVCVEVYDEMQQRIGSEMFATIESPAYEIIAP